MSHQQESNHVEHGLKQTGHVHLRYIDGLRGLAALYVVVHHFCLWSVSDVPHWCRVLLSWTMFGHFSVDVFITLSGFCLMLPVTASADHQLRGGFCAYLKRRAWRILPPYYAALMLALVVLGLTPQGISWFLNGFHSSDRLWLSNFEVGDIVSHFLLIHNLNHAWSDKLDMALWSIATEWQIYFFFPLLLLPIFRRFGAFSTVIAGFAIGILPHLLLPSGKNFDWACPWYLGLFALGMLSAVISTTSNPISANIRYLPFVTIITGILYVGAKFGLIDHIEWIKDATGGIIAATVIAYCAVTSRRGLTNPVLSFFSTNLIVGLGTWSYSLYLTHCLVLEEMEEIQHVCHMSEFTALILRIFVGIPVALGFAYVFFLLVERPFLKGRSTNRTAEPRIEKTGIARDGAVSSVPLG